jgi:CRISPR-associated endoribonuclease Cas6
MEVTLLAEPSLRPTPHQLHGLACSLLEGPDADHTGQNKPWTVWPLRAARPSTVHSPVPERKSLVLRMTWLPDNDLPAVARTLPDQVRLGSRFATVTGARTRQTTFDELADAAPARRAELTFHRPTYFSRSGRNLPLPDPVLVVASLTRRWNEFCPVALAVPEADAARLRRSVMLADVAGHTERVDRDPTVTRSGFVGEATLTLPRSCPDRVAQWLAALGTAAEHLGVGAGTTSGFGVVTARVGG